MLVRLIYVSYSSIELTDEDVAQILATSRINNKNCNITGLLMYSDRYFFQCLEGERKQVNKTYLRILADNRHSRCLIISYIDIVARLFPNWSMEQVKFNGVSNELVAKYSETGLFQPYDFSATQAEMFLSEVAKLTALEIREASNSKSLLSWFKA